MSYPGTTRKAPQGQDTILGIQVCTRQGSLREQNQETVCIYL